MHVGTIYKLYPESEHGKILTSAGEEAHFHKACLWNTPFNDLHEGDHVEFEMEPSHKGFRAFHIRREKVETRML
ncbi:MAG: cold shock domain-containing protein [Candidatus Omnitrophica bacterium]|nr:cold shock domain-containing protein [Candidatus Omnitrophota bacterium]